MRFVFDRDMCVVENTSRPANVLTVRLWRTVSALQQAAIPLSEKAAAFLTVSNTRGKATGVFVNT